MKRFCLIFFALILAAPFAAHAIEYDGLEAKPEQVRTDDPNAGQWFVYSVHPGTDINDTLLLTNATDSPKVLELYAADANPTGAQVFRKQGDPMEQVGEWITLGQTELVIAPQEQMKIPFTLKVPQNVGGDFVGGIMVVQKNSLARLGVPVYVTVATQNSGNDQTIISSADLKRQNENGWLAAAASSSLLAGALLIKTKKRSKRKISGHELPPPVFSATKYVPVEPDPKKKAPAKKRPALKKAPAKPTKKKPAPKTKKLRA